METLPKFAVAQYPEVEELLRVRKLRFPLPTKEDFVAQMAERGQVIFRNISYDPHFAAELMPEFFFPIKSEEDMVQKGVELMIARGLFPVQPKLDPVT
jgi:hypothetical protein